MNVFWSVVGSLSNHKGKTGRGERDKTLTKINS